MQELGIADDQVMGNMKAASNLFVINTLMSEYKYNGLFSRINYRWEDKYIINLSARRDGSSRFGAKNRFGNFGSIGAAWIFTEEKFIQGGLPYLHFGKIRASYGVTGNDQIDDYNYLSLYSPFSTPVPYQNTTGFLPSNLSNPYLEWEKTKKFQIGIDLGFVGDKILFNATFSKNRSSNQIVGYSLPRMTGY